MANSYYTVTIWSDGHIVLCDQSSVLDKFDASHLRMLAANISVAPSRVLDHFFQKVPADAFRGSLDKLEVCLPVQQNNV